MSYIVPDREAKDSPVAIGRRIVSEFEEFESLKDGEARVEYLIYQDEVIRDGRHVVGMACIPTVQGRLKDLFTWMLANMFGESPDFLILVEQEYWESADAKTREILIFHELCHCIHKLDRDGDPRYDEDGRPVWGILGHDLEEFNATVKRYGAYSEAIQEFIQAAGGAKP